MKALFEKDRHRFVLTQGYSVNRVSTKNGCPVHTHDYVEIVYGFGGKALHTVDGKPHILSKGDLLFINYGSTHSVLPKPHSDYADIMLKPEFLDERLKGTHNAFLLLELKDFKDFSETVERNKRFIHLSNDDRKQIESLIEMTLAEESNERSGTELVKRSALNILLNLIFRNMIVNAEHKLSINEALLDYIRDNCHEKLSVSELAKRCFYTEEHFSRSFKKYTGKTFTEYLNECRLNKAKALLSDTEKSVEDILWECGFSSRTRFFKRFSENTGMSPLKYRKISK